MLKYLAVAFGIMQVSGCLSVVAALLYERLGAAPVSVAISTFSAAFLMVILIPIKHRLEVRK